MQSVNLSNWSHCRFENKNFMAFISFGASPQGVEADELEYYVTVLENIENEQKEVFQEEFGSLTQACEYLNTHYGDWTFNDQTASKSGCSTCAAH
jgi:hypothetical protein